MPRAVILEILVARFKSPEIPLVFVHVVNVFAHQHAVLIFHQEIVRRIRLAPEFGEHRRDIHIHVREGVESFSQAFKIVPVKRQVRGDEIRFRMLGEQVVALGHQRFKRRIFLRRTRASRELL